MLICYTARRLSPDTGLTSMNIAPQLRRCRKLLFAMMLFFLPLAGVADSLDAPFLSSNLNPFVLVYSPPVAEDAQLENAGSLRFTLQAEVANSFTERSDGVESVFIDGETHRATARVIYSVSDALELGIAIPYISHESGRLDDLIENWHDTWSLPDGSRPVFEQDQLSYRYSDASGNLVAVEQSTDGLGDLRLTAAYQLASEGSRHWALRGSVKLPTGEVEDLTGSDSTDIALSLSMTERNLFDSANWVLHASGGFLWLGSSELLEERREDWVGLGSTTVSWRVRPDISLKVQVDAHSAFYDSDLKELGEPSVQLVFGGAINVGKGWLVDIAVSEDIAVDTAPDVVFLIGLNRSL